MLDFLILASQSPQRKRILKMMGIRFKAFPSRIDETNGGFSRPHAIAKHIALKKAEAVAPRFPKNWVLGCDTFVILSNGKLALKPKHRADAKKTIQTYRASYCDVYSGIALVNHSLNKKFVQFDKTRLVFGKFTDAAIEKYLDTGEWKGRSGSLTIEGKGGKWIKKIKGDYWNVVGLPVGLLEKMMERIAD